MVYGMLTELGELADSYKKHYAYGKHLDLVNVMEEMGDIMWYWAGMCTITGINASSTLQVNIDKLKARYPEKFDEQLAINRDLDQERRILDSGYEQDKAIE
jgi:NTP pyrophosphatase (non-canonical NTP hydrolase)